MIQRRLPQRPSGCYSCHSLLSVFKFVPDQAPALAGATRSFSARSPTLGGSVGNTSARSEWRVTSVRCVTPLGLVRPSVLAAGSSAKKRRCMVSRRPSHEPWREIISQGYFDQSCCVLNKAACHEFNFAQQSRAFLSLAAPCLTLYMHIYSSQTK